MLSWMSLALAKILRRRKITSYDGMAAMNAATVLCYRGRLDGPSGQRFNEREPVSTGEDADFLYSLIPGQGRLPGYCVQ